MAISTTEDSPWIEVELPPGVHRVWSVEVWAGMRKCDSVKHGAKSGCGQMQVGSETGPLRMTLRGDGGRGRSILSDNRDSGNDGEGEGEGEGGGESDSEREVEGEGGGGEDDVEAEAEGDGGGGAGNNSGGRGADSWFSSFKFGSGAGLSDDGSGGSGGGGGGVGDEGKGKGKRVSFPLVKTFTDQRLVYSWDGILAEGVRSVRVELPGKSRQLAITEVKVFTVHSDPDHVPEKCAEDFYGDDCATDLRNDWAHLPQVGTVEECSPRRRIPLKSRKQGSKFV